MKKRHESLTTLEDNILISWTQDLCSTAQLVRLRETRLPVRILNDFLDGMKVVGLNESLSKLRHNHELRTENASNTTFKATRCSTVAASLSERRRISCARV